MNRPIRHGCAFVCFGLLKLCSSNPGFVEIGFIEDSIAQVDTEEDCFRKIHSAQLSTIEFCPVRLAPYKFAPTSLALALRQQVIALETERNMHTRGITRQFNSRDTRHTLERLYPVNACSSV